MDGGPVWATILTGAQFQPRPSEHCAATLSTLRICTWPAPISHLTLHHFISPRVHWVGANRVPTPPSLLPGLLRAWGLCTVCLSISFEKSLLGTAAALSHCPAFYTVQRCGKSRVYLGHGQLWPTPSPSSRCHQHPPNSLAMFLLATTAPAWVHCPVFLAAFLLPLRQRL